MTEVKTIKDVDDETWLTFKTFAAKNDLKLGLFFKTMLTEYEKTTKTFWKEILAGKKILSDEEAEELEKTTTHVRKEYGFRT
ncbi:hypothetical protein HY484_01730 [Candidatus Woesearchaeota archaeon]|nr:hypothetical protein [Candidatus Woesearchaeota archaeon]